MLEEEPPAVLCGSAPRGRSAIATLPDLSRATPSRPQQPPQLTAVGSRVCQAALVSSARKGPSSTSSQQTANSLGLYPLGSKRVLQRDHDTSSTPTALRPNHHIKYQLKSGKFLLCNYGVQPKQPPRWSRSCTCHFHHSQQTCSHPSKLAPHHLNLAGGLVSLVREQVESTANWLFFPQKTGKVTAQQAEVRMCLALESLQRQVTE